MASELDGKRIAFLVAQEGVEEVELTKPWRAVEQAGGGPELLASESGPDGLPAFCATIVEELAEGARPVARAGAAAAGSGIGERS